MDKLNGLRKEMDKVDEGILRLIKKRITIARKIGKYKKKNKIRIYQPKREKEVVTRIKKLAKKAGIKEKTAERVFLEIIRYTRSREK